MNICITEQTTTIRNDNTQPPWKIQTENCFGLIYNSLERHFPNFNEDAIVTNCINYMRNAMTGKDIHPATSYKLLGRVERGHTLLFLREYFDGKESVAFSLQDVDKIRIASRMKSNYLPVSINETTSMEFDDLTNVTQVMVALLYYYSYYGFKLVKCRHCGRWFATKSLKNQYCKQISPCCGEILKGENTLSASSQRHYHLMLSSMFSTAVRWQLVDANPCERVTPPKLVEQDVEFLDEIGIADLLAALPDAPVQLSVITQLALFTGARRGEICGLRWSDIDLDAGVMAINRNLSYIVHKGTIFDYPKTKKSRRCIKLSDDCIALLKDYKQWQMRERLKVGTFWQRTITIEGGKLVKNDLLFTKPDGKPIDPNVVSSWFPVFLREHGLPPCRFHSLRHSNAALLIAAHVPATTVAGRLGHAQVSTTTNIYAAMIRSSDAAAADALGNVFDRIKQRQEIG